MDSDKFNFITKSLFIALIFWGCSLMILPFIFHMAWATILTVLTIPLYKRILSSVKKSSLAALISCLIVALIIVIPAALVSLKATTQAKDAIIDFQHTIEKTDFNILKTNIEAKLPAIVRSTIHDTVSPTQLKTSLLKVISNLGKYFVHESIVIGKNIVLTMVYFILTMVIFFYLLRDNEMIKDLVIKMLPLGELNNIALLKELSYTLQTTVRIELIAAVCQGTLGGISFFILGINSPILWGMIMSFFCLIPFMGAPAIWLPTAILLAIHGSYAKAIILVLLGVFVIGLIDNFIKGFLMKGSTNLHPLLILFSILGGAIALGPIGVFMGPVMLTAGLFLLKLITVEMTTKAN